MLFFESNEYTESVFEVVLTTGSARCLPSRDHVSGTCAVPLSGLVSRSAFEEPSLRITKNRGIALTIGLKRHVRSIRRPDWKAVPIPSPWNVRGRHRGVARQIVDPDRRAVRIFGAQGELSAIR